MFEPILWQEDGRLTSGISDQAIYAEMAQRVRILHNSLEPYAYTFGEPWPKQEESNIENVVGVFYD
jgi:hypothetical protein